MEQCPICHHKEHKAGQCSQCNCGESEIIQIAFGYYPSILEGNNRYVAGTIYDRKGQLRKQPLGNRTRRIED